MTADIVSIAIQQTKDTNQPLDEVYMARLMEFTDREIEHMKIFWDAVYKHSWIYLSDYIIKEWLTNETGRQAVHNFCVLKVIQKYTVKVDYEEVSKDHSLVIHHLNLVKETHGNRKKYYIISDICLKKLILTNKSQRNKELQNYYAKLEQLANYMRDYIRQLDDIKYKRNVINMGPEAMIVNSTHTERLLSCIECKHLTNKNSELEQKNNELIMRYSDLKTRYNEACRRLKNADMYVSDEDEDEDEYDLPYEDYIP